MKKILFLLLAFAAAGLNGSAPVTPQGTNAGNRTMYPTGGRRIAQATPGRQAEEFSQNTRLNWRHPYMSR